MPRAAESSSLLSVRICLTLLAGLLVLALVPSIAAGKSCSDFPTQADAQRALPNNANLDRDEDGVACETNPPPTVTARQVCKEAKSAHKKAKKALKSAKRKEKKARKKSKKKAKRAKKAVSRAKKKVKKAKGYQKRACKIAA